MPGNNSRATACDATAIDRFLSDQLSDGQSVLLVEHLDHCAACCQQLRDRAAGPSWWDEAGCYLQDEPLDLESAADNSRGALDALSVRDTPARVLEVLGPSDDPRMLGRLGTHEVTGVIGAGGMGVVLKALDPTLNRYVAIKVLAPYLASSGAARRRFAREAEAAAAVVHPHVIAIYSVDDSCDLPYLVMPYLSGPSLQRRLDDEGPLRLEEILRIGSQAAQGLAAAHAQGLVHRDIKPANILLGRDVQRVTITDFGLARAVDDATMTRSGVISGTPQYMSPEQASGEAVDHRSDLFSLGSVIYAMAAVRPPFRGPSTMGVLHRICQDQPRPLQQINPAVPDWLCEIVGRLHAKDPAQRIQTAAELAELLGACLAHVQKPDSMPLPASLCRSRPRWRRRAVHALAPALALAAALGAWTVWPRGDAAAPDSPVRPAWTAGSAIEWNDQLDDEMLEIDHDLTRLEQQMQTAWPSP